MKAAWFVALTLGACGAPQERAQDLAPAVDPARDPAPDPAPVPPPVATPVAAAVRPSQLRATVHAGETLALRDADVIIEQVTWEKHPCPKGQKCLTSGLVQNVQVHVLSAGKDEMAVIAAGATRVVLGVEVRVHSVEPSQQADVEARQPLAAPTPPAAAVPATP